MHNKRNEPSKAMIQRMMVNAPQQLAEELLRTRTERDIMKGALVTKLSDYVKTIKIQQDDILVLKPLPGNDGKPISTMNSISEELCKRLSSMYGWNGMILVLNSAQQLDKIEEAQAREIYGALKRRFEPCESKMESSSLPTQNG